MDTFKQPEISRPRFGHFSAANFFYGNLVFPTATFDLGGREEGRPATLLSSPHGAISSHCCLVA